MMTVFDTPAAQTAWSDAQRSAGRRIALVPTMGALHDGHLELLREARRHGDVVVASVFVNPLQFNRRDDFDSYPRPVDDDLQACADAGVDAVYAPTPLAMYPERFQTHVEPGPLAEPMEGAMRPGHFRGVTTVVTKLFNAARPHVAMFGQKDYQQLAVIRQMTADLDMGIEIVSVPTVREADGLALSSRNRRLMPLDRAAAVVVPRALGAAVSAFEAGQRSAGDLVGRAMAIFANEPRARVEYVEVADAVTLAAIDDVIAPAVMAVAVWFGDVRLIDNVLLVP
jgi:pantoate--beta-alanine ligase